VSRRGEPWEGPRHGGTPLDVIGGDASLASALARHAATTIHFVPDATSDLARALGLGADTSVSNRGSQVEVDVLHLRCDGAATPTDAVNMVVSGPAPDRLRAVARRRRCQVLLDGAPWWDGPATTVVIANGEFLRGADLVPRGHPGDGRLEVQVYALAPRARRAMRGRLATGTHLPHPSIRTGQGHEVAVRWDRTRRLEVDGVAHSGARAVAVDLVPAALRLAL
jgi:putative lipid kinase YegS-like protein